MAGAFGGEEIKGDFGGSGMLMVGGEGMVTFGGEGTADGAFGMAAGAGAAAGLVTLLPRRVSPNLANIVFIFSPLFAEAS